MYTNKLIPVILCGGKGSRLWPLSRQSFPKQYLNLEDDNKNTLLQNTYKRLDGIDNLDDPIIICNEEHRFIVAEQLREINTKPKSILLEPFGRGTAAAVTIAALKSIEYSEDPILLILSSDHVIKDMQRFQESLKTGIKYAEKGKLVTLGVIPEYPETGYGYIKTKEPAINNACALSIEKFIEKPNFKQAKEYISNKHFSWNSGIFLFKASKILEEIKKFEPEIILCCKKSINKSNLDLDFQRIDKSNFNNCPNISLDIAIMEKTKLGVMVSLKAGWKDIGSWSQVYANLKKDKDGNSIKGNIICKDTKDSLIRSENRLIVTAGIKDLIIVDTYDALLIIDNKKTQEIKNIVEEINKKNLRESIEHKTIYRPWGYYTLLVEGINWQLKKIVVKPKQSLSLQSHNYRSEHWIIVSGRAKVEIDGKVSILENNQGTYIPIKSKHRLTNPDSKLLILIEVQSGSNLSENDIVRYEDSYGRIAKK